MIDEAIAFLKYQNHKQPGFHLCSHSLGFLKQFRSKCKIIYSKERDQIYSWPSLIPIHLHNSWPRKGSRGPQTCERGAQCLEARPESGMRKTKVGAGTRC